jgi:hypothetical protein
MGDEVASLIRNRNIHRLADLLRFALSRCNNAACIFKTHH